jgi:hypothetical protein
MTLSLLTSKSYFATSRAVRPCGPFGVPAAVAERNRHGFLQRILLVIM